MTDKPQFTEQEIEEMDDLHINWGYMCAIGEVMNFLKTLGYSDVNAVVIELRKEFANKKLQERQDKFNEKWKNSTLYNKLSDRLNWAKNNKL